MRLPVSIFNLISPIVPDRFQWVRRIFVRKCGIQLGENVHLGVGLKMYGSRIKIEDGVWISPDCVLYATADASINIQKNCDIGPGVRFICGSHKLGGASRRAGVATSADIEVGAGCWIGAGSIVLGGARLGAGSIVGAGSTVLNRSYPENALYCGVPACLKRYLHP